MSTPAQVYTGISAEPRPPLQGEQGYSAPPNGGQVSEVGAENASIPSSGPTITMIAPDGSTGEVPIKNLDAAKAAGGKVAVKMQSPQGEMGWVPADSVHAAASAGAKMVPMDVPEPTKASYWDALTNPVGSGGREQGVVGGTLQVGGQAIKALAQPVAHPIDTIEGLYNTVRHPIDTGEAIGSQIRSDYDQGGVPLAAENVAGQELGAAESGRIAAPIANAALKSLPAAVGRTVLLGKTPEGAYEAALKPSTVLSQPERAEIVQTALQNSIPISKGGLENLTDLIDDYNEKIKGTIAADPNRPIDPNAAASNVDQAKARFANQVNAQGDLSAIENSRQQFLREQGAPTDLQGNVSGPAPMMGAAQAQAMKQGTYRVLAGKYGEQGSAAVEAQKAIARGLKDEIATQFPEIGKMNAAESKLLDLQPVLERAVNRISNHQKVGIGTPVVGAAMTGVTHSGLLGGASMVLKGVLDNPTVASRLAIAVSKGGGIPYSQALARVQAYSTALGSASSVGRENSNDGTPSQ